MRDASSDGAQPAAPARSAGRRTAVGIYGTIITAAILASAGDELKTPELALSVLITLVVYWVAEEYAEVLGEHLAGGRMPTWRYVRAALAATWPLVSASYSPLLLLVLAWLLGASPRAAANVGLGAAVAELMIYAWLAGRAAELRGRQQLALTAAAAVLGLVMITLKDVVLIRLH
jgi:hypothetical protein